MNLDILQKICHNIVQMIKKGEEMRNTTKIHEFIETIAELIRTGAPGFIDRLPSRRELAAQYGISPASVQIALQELEKRGLVTNIPQKGSRVAVRPGAAGVATSERREVVEVTVFENLPHQTAFWLERFRDFERRNPGFEVRARFCDSKAAIPEGTRVALRLPRRDGLPPAVPLNEIFGNERFDRVRHSALAQFSDWDWSLFLPYQVQMHAFIYRGPDSNPLVPARDETVTAWLERVYARLGERSLLPPRNDWLAACCGVVDLVGRSLAGIESSPELSSYFNSLAFYAQKNLINHEISPEEPHAHLLQSGRLAGLIDFTHHWNSFRLLEQGNEFQIGPLPFAPGAANGVFIAHSALFGTDRVHSSEQHFFEYLVSPDFQFAQMDALMGLSPFLKLLKEEQSRIPKLAPLIEQFQRQPFRRCSEEPWAELSELLMEPVLLPLIMGEISAKEGERAACPVVKRFFQSRNSARKRNLRSFLREVV